MYVKILEKKVTYDLNDIRTEDHIPKGEKTFSPNIVESIYMRWVYVTKD